jgi:hypothetical protein
VKAGDYIEIGMLGAYGARMRTLQRLRLGAMVASRTSRWRRFTWPEGETGRIVNVVSCNFSLIPGAGSVFLRIG